MTERSAKIQLRWTPNQEEYKKELEAKMSRKCSKCVQKMKTVCEERLFLLKLKEKYLGK